MGFPGGQQNRKKRVARGLGLPVLLVCQGPADKACDLPGFVKCLKVLVEGGWRRGK